LVYPTSGLLSVGEEINTLHLQVFKPRIFQSVTCLTF